MIVIFFFEQQQQRSSCKSDGFVDTLSVCRPERLADSQPHVRGDREGNSGAGDALESVLYAPGSSGIAGEQLYICEYICLCVCMMYIYSCVFSILFLLPWFIKYFRFIHFRVGLGSHYSLNCQPI